MPKLHELVARCDVEAVASYVAAEYEESGEGYREVIADLRGKTPVDSPLTIVVSLEPADDLNERPYWDVSSRDADGKLWSLGFMPWSEMLGMEVTVAGCDLTPDQALAHVLWEMTFYGFSEQSMEEQRDDLRGAVADIEAALDQLPENPTESDYESVGLHVFKEDED